MAEYELKVYVTGRSKEGGRAINKLKRVLENEVEEDYELEVIDITKKPELAEEEKILATPLVEKRLPEPVKRVIGEITDEEDLLFGLDLVPEEDFLEEDE